MTSDDSKIYNFDKEIVLAVWQKGTIIPGMDPLRYRVDSMGYIMAYGRYGTRKEFGWSIDYILHPDDGGLLSISNLVPRQWENFQRKQEERNSLNAMKQQVKEEEKTKKAAAQSQL